jgi:hypothetical protein
MKITGITVAVFAAAIAMFAFFPIAITAFGLISIGYIAHQIGNHYDEVYQREARDKMLDQNHEKVQVIRLKHPHRPSKTA